MSPAWLFLLLPLSMFGMAVAVTYQPAQPRPAPEAATLICTLQLESTPSHAVLRCRPTSSAKTL